MGTNPAWCARLCRHFPGRVALGIDARQGRVATDGWQHVSGCSALDLARQCAAWPLAAIIYTDIARDGMLGGPNLEALAVLAAAVPIPVIASGGVTTINNVRELMKRRLFGCIIGRALYEGQIDLSAVLELVSGSE